MKRLSTSAIMMTAAFLLATVPALARPSYLGPLSPSVQIVLDGPDWSFGPDVTPITTPLNHSHMVVSEGCDFNGDGFDDILVGRRDFSSSGFTHNGRVWLFLGSASGLPSTPSLTFDPPVNNTYGFFGGQVVCLGHVNNDIYDDFAIGMDNYDSAYSDEGAVFVYYGSDPPNATYDWMARGNTTYGHLGFTIDSAGDVNGDTYDDLIAGTLEIGSPYNYIGRAYVWFGGSSGLGDTGLPSNADWSAAGTLGTQYGVTVRGIGDVDGDTYDDILIGAHGYDGTYTDQGAVFVYHGSSGGLGAPGNIGNADWSATGDQGSAHLGWGADGVGDLDGDGADDLAVGAYLYDNPEADEGKVFVWYGETGSGLGANGTPANADWSAEMDVEAPRLGYVVRSGGDVNDDGYAELLATAYNFPVPDNGGTLSGAGAWFLWYGSESGLGENGTPANADLVQYCNQAGATLGRDEAGAADVNGDGKDEIFVVAFNYDDPETNEGVVGGWWAYYQSIFLPLVMR